MTTAATPLAARLNATQILPDDGLAGTLVEATQDGDQRVPLRSRLIGLQHLQAGDTVGYGSSHTATGHSAASSSGASTSITPGNMPPAASRAAMATAWPARNTGSTCSACAGSGRADPASLIAAYRMARRLAVPAG